MKLKLTPWFPKGVKPARPGVYQVKIGDNESGIVGYAYWSGKRWGPGCWTAKSAIANKAQKGLFQNRIWSGILK